MSGLQAPDAAGAALFAVLCWIDLLLRRFPRCRALLRLPATILHESAHYLAALVTGGAPCGMSIIPRREGGRLVLGTVTLGSPGILSLFPCGAAPLFLLFPAVLLFRLRHSLLPPQIPHFLLLYSLLYLCCSAAVPSRKDLETAFSSLAGAALYGAVAGGLVLLVWG